MEENFVGYLLNTLDPDARREVETHLDGNTTAQRQLEQLRRALEPLAADAEVAPPAPGLWLRTLAHIAEHRCRPLPSAPKPTTHVAGASRGWWRRADLLVAASLLLLAGGLGIHWLSHVREENRIVACANNLSHFYRSLVTYASLHNGNFPQVESDPPRNVAGIFIPHLNDARLLSPDISVACPGSDVRCPISQRSMTELEELHRRDPQAFRAAVRDLAGCYAYSLGYQTLGPDGKLYHNGLRQNSGDDLPIMADAPPFREGSITGGPGNSKNHGGRGQNVLHIGGNVIFLPISTLGNDNIYLNRHWRVEAGDGPRDTVLGASWAKPYPHQPD